jgi:hypothetical protein
MAEKTLRRTAEIRMAALATSADHGSKAAYAEHIKIRTALANAKDDAALAIALRDAGVHIEL